MPKYYMVLNDGETYTELEGCAIVVVADYKVDSPDFDEVIKHADGYICFDDVPPIELKPNNGVFLGDVLGEESDHRQWEEEYELGRRQHLNRIL